MIELNEVSKVFNQGQPNECRALRAVSLTLDRGGSPCSKVPAVPAKPPC